MPHVLAQDLRNAVLQAAISGDLSSFYSEDTPIEKTVSLMTENRDNLFKNKKEKKANPTGEVTDIELFDIPNHWRWYKLGDIGTLTRGSGIKRTDVVEKGLPCIRYGQMYTTYKNKIERAVSYVPEDVYEKSQKVRTGDLVMALTGENNYDIALAAAYLGHEDIAMGGDMAKWSNHYMNPMYLVMVINSEYGISWKRRMAKGDMIVHISNDKLANIMIPLPPVEEQARIVARVDELMAKIDEYEKIEKELVDLHKAFPGNMKDAILQAAFEGKLTSQEKNDGSVSHFVDKIRQKQEELLKNKAIKVGKYSKDYSDDLPEIPDNWRYIKMGDISSLVTKQTGFDYSKTIKPSLLNKKVVGTVPYIQTRDFNFKNFNFDTKFWAPIEIVDKYPNITLNGKHLLLSIVGSIGNVGLYDFNKTCLLGGAITKIDLLDDNLYDYVYYYLQSPLGQKEISKNKHQTAQATVTVEDMRSIAIPLPPLEEQQRIVDKLDRLLPLCESLEVMI